MLKLCHLSTWALLSLQLLPTSANGHAHQGAPVYKRDDFAYAVKTPSKADSSRGRLPMTVGGDYAKIGFNVSIGTPRLRHLPLFIRMGDRDSFIYIKGLNTKCADYDPALSSTAVTLRGEWGHEIGFYGKYFTDLFSLGDLPAVRQNFIGIISTRNDEALDDMDNPDGFCGQIGLGLRDNEPMVGNTFMEGLFKAGAISKKLFALQVSSDSFIQFGAINHSAYVDHLLWSPVLTHVGGWAVQADGFVVNNKVVPNTGGPLQFETASAYTTIPERIASKLFAHIDHKLSKFDSDSTLAQLLFKCDISDKESVGYSIKGRMYSLALKTLVSTESKTEYPGYCLSPFAQVADKSSNFSVISALFMQMFYGIFELEHDDGKPAVGLALPPGW
ncbi:BQ2448_6095 [Microbotryum intermedium]|uniref:BQ2448_6095 protein n=1 Tax=Microbotryum intermedium TaxID=269621 RepID=A0A238FKI3_9BASI|nr:BQ2448_6095 [Microbotryum intermedium]